MVSPLKQEQDRGVRIDACWDSTWRVVGSGLLPCASGRMSGRPIVGTP